MVCISFFLLVQCFDASPRVVFIVTQSWAQLSQSEQMSAGITVPARARVSITANLIICQYVSRKIIPVSFHLDISWERHTSESKPVWYHVRFGSSAHAVSIHVRALITWVSLTGEMQILMKMSQSEPSPRWYPGFDVWSGPICIIDPLQFPDNAKSSVG